MIVDLGQIIINVSASMTRVAWLLLWALAGLLGFLYSGSVAIKMFNASKGTGTSQVKPGEIVGGFIAAAMVAQLSLMINAALQTMGLGMTSFGPIDYPGAATFGKLGPVLNAALTLSSVIGGFMGLKGLVLLYQATSGGSSGHGGHDMVWRAMTHLFAGACLVQVGRFIEMAVKTISGAS